jgi:hypothetical protein
LAAFLNTVRTQHFDRLCRRSVDRGHIYMGTTDGRPSGQSWGTFLRNHLQQIAAMDLFVVPTIGFNLLNVLVWRLFTSWLARTGTKMKLLILKCESQEKEPIDPRAHRPPPTRLQRLRRVISYWGRHGQRQREPNHRRQC